MINIFIIMFGCNRTITETEVAVEILAPKACMGPHINEKTGKSNRKKIVKQMKIENVEKVVWRYGG